MMHPLSVNDFLEMEWQSSRAYCQDNSYSTFDSKEELLYKSVTLFIADDKDKRLCIFVRIDTEIDSLFDKLDLFKNPELFDMWDGDDWSDDIDLLIDSIVLTHKVELCLQ